MNNDQLLDLADCTEFRQRLQAKTPPAVSLMLLLLLLLVAAAVVWAVLAKVSLVVVAQGRIRPSETPQRIYPAITAHLEGRVSEVFVKEGDRVAAGDVLLQLDTSKLDNEIAKHTHEIAAGKAELAELRQLVQLLEERTTVAQSQARAELQQQLDKQQRDSSRRKSEIRRAAAALAKSRDHANRIRLLVKQKVETASSWMQASTQMQQDEAALQQAKLPIDEGAIAVRRQALALVDRDHQLKHAELAARIARREGQVKAAGKELANRQYERQHAELRAPLDGVIVTGNVKVGDLLQAGQPALEIAESETLRFEAQVSSEEIGDLREGMDVTLKLDAFDFQKFGTLGGEVSYISPDSQTSDNEKGESFYRVRIDLRGKQLSRGDLVGQVKLGMAGVAEIVTDRDSLLAVLMRQIRKTIRIE
jgi:adhesin transport system membrane fusion protein